MSNAATHTPPAAQAQHAALIVAFEAGDLSGAEQDRAAGLLASCDGCAELCSDLAAIRVATAALPAPRRVRDYRLTDADAARLRPTFRNRVLGWLAAPRSTVRPLAGGLAALGIAGLLLVASPGIPGPAAVAVAPVVSTASPADAAGAGENAAPRVAAPVSSNGPAAAMAPAPSPEAQPASSAEPRVAACLAPVPNPATPGPLGAAGGGECTKSGSGAGPVTMQGATDSGPSPSPGPVAANQPASLPSPAATVMPPDLEAPATAPVPTVASTPGADRTPFAALSIALLVIGLLLAAARIVARRAVH